MVLEDPRGVELTGCSAAALDVYEKTLLELLTFHGDPLGNADQALALDSTLVSAHLLKAHCLVFSLHPALMPMASDCLAAAVGSAANARERQHMEALGAWLDGDIDRSCRAFTAILDDHPRDLLALMFAHQADFFGADEAALLERPSAVLKDWDEAMPGYGSVLAMRAFGLEEAGAYGEAEALALQALEHDAKDAWAIHAKAHVLEMQGRDEEGIAWYRARVDDWSEDCFFAVHNWWHWALYQVDRNEPEAALSIYDSGLAPDRRSITLNLADAASLLWRLSIAGHDVGQRFAKLAECFDRPAKQSLHVFTDVHAMLAFAGDLMTGGTADRAVEHLQLLEGLAGGESQHSSMLRAIGVPAARAVMAFAQDRSAEAYDLLADNLEQSALMTGSRAQRDVLTMTLIEAAIRSGDRSSARRLLEQRLRAKPASERIARDLSRCR